MQECENLGLNLISFDHEGEYLAVLEVVRDIGKIFPIFVENYLQ